MREETRKTKNEDERKRGERFNRAYVLVGVCYESRSCWVGISRNTDSHGCSSSEIRRKGKDKESS